MGENERYLSWNMTHHMFAAAFRVIDFALMKRRSVTPSCLAFLYILLYRDLDSQDAHNARSQRQSSESSRTE